MYTRKAREIDSIVGNKYNKLTVVEYAGLHETCLKTRIYRTTLWLCVCDCGGKITVKRSNLISGNTKSCGCLKEERNIKLKGKGIQNNILPPGEAALNAYFGCYKYRAKKKSIQFGLTLKNFKTLIYKNCHFCGEPPFRQYPTSHKNKTRPYNGFIIVNGIDRINSTIGYTKKNCLPCCEICNKAKRDLTLKEFSDWIQKISNHNKL